MSKTEVDLSIYGKYDISGVRDGDPEPCPKFWDAERKTWSDSWKENLYESEVKNLEEIYEEMQIRCRDKLPAPKTLLEIAKFGIDEPDLATCAFAEILE
jgi:small subunit ribosomal protein S29